MNNSILMKQLILSYFSTNLPFFVSSPITCYVFNTNPFTLTDGLWSFPAIFLNTPSTVPVLHEKLEISKYDLIVENETLCMKIEKYNVLPKKPNEVVNNAICYKNDPDIKSIISKLGRSKKQSKYKLSLPKSLKESKIFNSNDTQTKTKLSQMQSKTRNTAKATVKKFLNYKTKKTKIAEGKTIRGQLLVKNNKRKIRGESVEKRKKIEENIKSIRLDESEYMRFIEWRERRNGLNNC